MSTEADAPEAPVSKNVGPDGAPLGFDIVPPNQVALSHWLGIGKGSASPGQSPDHLFEQTPCYRLEMANAAAQELPPMIFMFCGPNCLYRRPLHTNQFWIQHEASGEFHRETDTPRPHSWPTRWGCTFCSNSAQGGGAQAPEATWDRFRQHLKAFARAPSLGQEQVLVRLVGAELALRPERLAEEITRHELPPSRWLLEYRADTLVRRAAEVSQAATVLSAERHGLDVCLLGIESFAMTQLDRFNKGYGPEVNLRALRVLRQLEEDHPGVFRFRTYGGLSTILFDPWSRPAEIALNLAIVTHFRLEQLCGKLLTSRLRLEDGLPLTTRARTEGLVREAYDDDALDTAAHNFYPAEIPWRFRDSRLEPFVRLALRLAPPDETATAHGERTSRTTVDELTEELQRWQRQVGKNHVQLAAELLLDLGPGENESPAKLLHRTQHRLQGGPPATKPAAPAVAAATADELFERDLNWVVRAFRAGIKPVVKLEDSWSEAAQSRIVAGWKAEWPGLHAAYRQSQRQGSNTREVFVGHQRAEVEEALKLTDLSERQQRPAELQQSVTRLGQLLGYPVCCARAFAEDQPLFGGNNEWLHVARRVGTAGEVDPRFNPRSIGYVPCSLSCNESLQRMELLPPVPESAPGWLPPETPTLILLHSPVASFRFEPVDGWGDEEQCVTCPKDGILRINYRPRAWQGLCSHDEKVLLAGSTLVVEPGLIRVEDKGRELGYFPLNAFVWRHDGVIHREFWQECVLAFEIREPSPGATAQPQGSRWAEALERGLRQVSARRPELLAHFSPSQVRHHRPGKQDDEVVVTLRRADGVVAHVHVCPKKARRKNFLCSKQFALFFGPDTGLSGATKKKLAHIILALAERTRAHR
jgi:hypothetical protein